MSAESAPDLATGARRALVCGIDGYERLPSLSFAAKDCRDVAGALAAAGFQTTDLAPDPSAPPSVADISGAIANACTRAAMADTLWVQLSGHGYTDASGASWFWVKNTDPAALSTTAVDLRAIAKHLQDSKAQHKVLVLDLCRYVQGAPMPTYRFDVSSLPAVGVSIVSSVALESFAWEPQPGEADRHGRTIENGLHTHFLLRGLEGDADGNGDRWVTLRELAAHADAEVRQQTRLAQRACCVSDGGAAFDVPLRPLKAFEVEAGAAAAARRDALAKWADVLLADPDPAIVKDPALRERIAATGWPWRVRDRNSGIVFVLIPDGSFVMGSADGDPGRDKDEVQHTRTIGKPFYMSEWEITIAQFQRKKGSDVDSWMPKDNISWDDAQRFCKTLGNQVRLPSEAEWEYACRAGTNTSFFFGYELRQDVANFNDGTRTANKTWAQKVNEQGRNNFGLYGMHGNVWEWVQDAYAPYQPELGQAAFDGNKGQKVERVLRGGGYASMANDCRSAERGKMKPQDKLPGVGLRVARSLP